MSTPPARRRIALAAAAAALVSLAGCSTINYSFWQKFGYEKRDILVSRVEKARDTQTAAKQQFTSTLDQFKQLTNFNGGDLEAEYRKLNGSYTDCQSQSTALGKRVDAVDKVATDLFADWKDDLSKYHDENLKARSQQEYDDSQRKYNELIATMRRSQASMTPVLQAFGDRVMFLKDHLNAAAISSLQTTTAAGIDTDVQQLIAQMNKSIDEANAFIDGMKSKS